VVDGFPVEAELGADAGHVLQWAPDLQLALWYGPEATLERWRDDLLAHWPQASVGEEEAIVLPGGMPARRQRVELPAETAEGGFPTADAGFELRRFETPVRVTGAMALEHEGLPVLVSCTLPADEAGPALERLDHMLRPLGGGAWQALG
jgi:hypothetical protein